MRWIAPLLSLTLALGAGAIAPKTGLVPATSLPAVQVDGHDALAGRLIVHLREAAAAFRSTDRATLADLPELSSFAATRNLRASEPLIRAELDEVARQSGFDRVLIVDLDSAADLARERELWLARPEVEAVEYDWIVRAQLVPNDPYFSGQWALRNQGGGGYTNDCDIDAELAWDVTTGSSTVKIAVIDTGVRLTHNDLSAKIVPGYDYVNNDATASDDNGHGTACASLAAASTNNSSGMAGVDWNARIMPLKALDAGGSGYTTDIINCVNWARTNGANVISMSLGGGAYSSTFNTAINNAFNAGIPVVCAAGNDNVSSISYPAAYTNAFAVGALSPCNQRKSPSSCDGEYWWGSNYGTGLDLLSPGVLLRSAWNSNNNSYITDMNGTSGATPIVAGVAALMRGLNPTLTAQQIYDILDDTADDLGAAGWDSQTGWGRLNAHAAVQAAVPDPCAVDSQDPTVEHTPLGMMVADGLPYLVAAVVEDNCEVAQVFLDHVVGGGGWIQSPMTLQGGQYLGQIPAQPAGSTVTYEITAVDGNGNIATAGGTFYVADPCLLDGEAPTAQLILPSGDTDSETEPVLVMVLATDPCGIAAMDLSYQVDGGAAQWVAGQSVGDDLFAAEIPAQPFGSLVEADVLVTDASPQANPATLSFSYQVVDPCGADTGAPVVQWSSVFPASAETGQAVPAVATASDPCGIQGATLTCSLDGGPVQTGTVVEGAPGEFLLELPAQASPGTLAWTLVIADDSPAHNAATLGGSLAVLAVPDLDPPAVVVTVLSASEVQVAWPAVPEASGYRLEAATSPEGPWTALSDGASLSRVVGVAPDQLQLLRVVAHN